jgi:hypothetical protein
VSLILANANATSTVSYVFYIMGRAIVIAVILQSDPSIKRYLGLRAGKQLNQEYTHNS